MDITMNEYDEGDVVRCRGEFRDVNGTLADPAVIKFRFTSPGADVVEYVYLTDDELTKVSTGIYLVELDTTGKPGTWHYRFFSTGNGQAAEQSQFHVGTARP
jgi:hypothetical protein